MDASSRWKSLLLIFCAIGAIVVLSDVADQWGVGGRPWFGFFDASNTPDNRPFVLVNGGTTTHGATDRAGIRDGDWIDLRELPFDVRFREAFQPMATQRIIRRFHRGAKTFDAPFIGSSVWEGAVKWKLGNQIPELLAKIWMILCAFVIGVRRSAYRDARLLALAIVSFDLADSIGPQALVIPNALLSLGFQAVNDILFGVSLVSLVVLARPYGARSRVRAGLEFLAYATIALNTGAGLAGILGLGTLWFDPLPYLFGAFWFYESLAANIMVAAVSIAAVATTPASDRQRAAWLLLPLSITLFFSEALSQLNGLIADWYVFIASLALSNVALALGAFAVTYALLNKRVLDFGFVLNRALVLTSVMVAVTAGFALLELLLAVFFAHASRGTIVLLSAVLTMILGLAMPRLYRWLERSIERYFFAREFRARANVARLASSLPFAESAESIDATLTHAVTKAFHLHSCTVWRRDNDGKVSAKSSFGWSSEDAIDHVDVQRLMMSLQTESGILRLEDEYLISERLPAGDREPAAALPLRARGNLIGMVLYSARSHGVAFDPEDSATLVGLAVEASRGYDAVELAARVEVAYQARVEAEAQAKETLRRANAALERINEAQARFMPNEFLRYLGKDSITDVTLGDSVQGRMTVLFSDIRSFTTLSEGMTPEQIFSFLNRYLQRAEPIVSEHGGFIDKYIGDAIMGLFPESADDALMAGIDMQREVRVLNRRLQNEGLPSLAIGVGLHTGDLMLGTIGGRNRMETTVIADAVNAASRLESATKTFGCGIVLSRATYDSLNDKQQFLLRDLGSLHVKGKHDALHVFEAFDADAPDLIVHKQQTLNVFHDAIEAFRNNDFEAAHRNFGLVASAHEADYAARYYADLSQQLRQDAVAG